MSEYPHLLAPIKLAGVTLKNRILSAPTSLAELSAEGHLTPDNILYYRMKAAGGCAAVFIGDAIAHGATGIAHPRQIALDDPDTIPSLVDAASAIHAHDCLAAIQIDHGGALSEPGFLKDGRPLGPSDYTHAWGERVYGMSAGEIDMIVEAFGRAAATVKSCGFDMIQLHSGHGWLLHQFISPIMNTRTDEYGGSFENRMRFPLRVLESVRAAVGKDFPIEVRISAEERISAEGEATGYAGYDFETGRRIAEAYDGKADLIHVSVGNNNDWESATLMISSCFMPNHLNADYAADIKKIIKHSAVSSVGAWTDVDEMEAFLAETGVDMVSLGRALVADPFLPKKALRGEADDITPCLRCNECVDGMHRTRTIRCTVNPYIGREREYFNPLPQTAAKKKVLVAGGGPAGLTAATECAKRGHDVVLCEQAGEPGGALFFADGVEFKRGIEKLRGLLVRRAERSGAEIRSGTRVDAALIAEVKPDVLICAVGGLPIVPPIPGADGSFVVFGSDVRSGMPLGKRVVVVGGGLVGMETALHLSEDGHEVTVVEMREEIAPDANTMHKAGLFWRMKGNENLRMETEMRVTEIRKDGVTAVDAKGAEKVYRADTVILSVGIKADAAQTDALRGLASGFYAVGDGKKARKIMQAIQEGYDVAVDIGLPARG
jgi:2,4-dienoyl-CoA reductase-like NADH-dependent reductase (Old Yellow Enzyme family)/thioredoxin reductase